MHITITTISQTGWKLKLWFISFHFTHPWLLWASCLLNGSLEKFPHFYILFSWLFTIPAHWGIQVQLQGESLPGIPDRQAFPKTENLQGLEQYSWPFTPPSVSLLEPGNPSPRFIRGGGLSLYLCSSPEEVRRWERTGSCCHWDISDLPGTDFAKKTTTHSQAGKPQLSKHTDWLVLWEDAGSSPPETCTHGVLRNRHHLIYPLHFSSLVGGKRGLRSSA